MTWKGLDIDKGTAMYRGKTFFDILEEVIENKRRQQIETVVGFRGLQMRKKAGSNTGGLMQEWTNKRQSYQKSIPIGAKGDRVEESKKGYTGDALALRGDEGRDKLR